jgi:hypothetical protein
MTKSTQTLTQSGLLAVLLQRQRYRVSSWPGVAHTASASKLLFGIPSPRHGGQSWSMGRPTVDLKCLDAIPSSNLRS